MPFTTLRDIGAEEFVVSLEPPPLTESASGTGWSRPDVDQMSYYAATRPQELFYEVEGLGADELHELERLPKSLVSYLAEEAQDPAFLRDYLTPALRSENPYKKIMGDITREAIEYEEEVRHGDLGLGKKKKGIFKKIRKVTKKVAQTQRKIHAKITPKFMQKIQKKVGKVGKKVWKQYGGIIIAVVGAVLAPFTAGATLALVTIGTAMAGAAKALYDKKKAADAAKRAGKADANLMVAEANKQEAETTAQVDKFYAENQAWFLQYELTPDKWAKLTVEQKIEFINAGVEGRLPKGTQDVNVTPEQATQQTQQTNQAAANAGIPQAAVHPTGAGPGVGYDTSAGGAPPPDAPEAQTSFEAVVEGQNIGTFPTANDAFTAILAATKPGDRFEIIAGGKSLGLAIRTAEGAVEVPPEAEAKMRSMSQDQSHAVVEQAEAETGKSKGGFPWWILLVGGVAVAAAS